MGYSTLKAALDAVVKTNGQQQITGSNLNGVMTTLLKGVDVLDRANPADTSGMNKVVLDKSKTFAEQVTGTNTIYEIRDAFDLGGDTITIPDGCILYFNGGLISNGVVNGEKTRIQSTINTIFGADLTFGGTWDVEILFPQWFGAKGDGTADCADAFQRSIDSPISLHIVVIPGTYRFNSGIIPFSWFVNNNTTII